MDITLNIYSVVDATTIGPLLGSVTQTFQIPWRPEPDPVNCFLSPTRFQSTPSPVNINCFNGLAIQITFDLSSLNLVISGSQIIWGVVFNTQSYGPNPAGVDGPWNSLNLGVSGTGASIGTDLDPASAWVNYGNGQFYCDSGAGGTGTFRFDGGSDCWLGNTPNIAFTAREAPP
jgi:hypothetical protein